MGKFDAAMMFTTPRPPEPRDDHAAYIASWLKVLKSDSRAIFTAAAHAQRAADFLNGLTTVATRGAAA